MAKLRNPFKNLTKFEWALWITSLAAIAVSFFAVGNTDYWTLVVSMLGVTALIFAAKGDAFAMIIMICFSLIYAFVSFSFKYYGETIIYTCMQIPISIVSLISWLKHPSDKGSAEVKIGKVTRIHALIIPFAAAGITAAFYFILRTFGTQNLIPSTVSVCTSFIALYLMALRVPAYAVAFMLNDVVLIVLWSMACAQSLNYVPMVVCFSIFLVNDTYTFICWMKRSKLQKRANEKILSAAKNTDVPQEN